MASFRDARNLLTAALCDDLISEDEYLLLYDLNRSKNLDLPYDEFTFDLDEMENSECVAEFRVNKHDLPALAEALQISDVFKCRHRSISDGMEGLCMLLRRLSILGYDSTLWKTHTGTKHDYQRGDRLHLQQSQPPNHAMESHYFTASATSRIRKCNPRKGSGP